MSFFMFYNGSGEKRKTFSVNQHKLLFHTHINFLHSKPKESC